MQFTLHRLEQYGQKTVDLSVDDLEFLLDETKRLAKEKEDCGRYITEKLDNAIAGGVKRLGELKERVRLLGILANSLVYEQPGLDPTVRRCSVCWRKKEELHDKNFPCAILNPPEE